MIALPIIKQHCRIEQDFTEDDELIKTYAQAARRHVENFTRRVLVTAGDERLTAFYARRARRRAINEWGDVESDIPLLMDGDPLLIDDDVRTAILMLVAHWYENREAVQMSSISHVTAMAVKELLEPYKVYGV